MGCRRHRTGSDPNEIPRPWRTGLVRHNQTNLDCRERPASSPSSCGRPPIHSVRRPLPHFAAYGSTNKYRPVKNCKASTTTPKRPILELYLPRATATPLTMTATVKAMDSQRWVCRIHLFQFNRTSLRLLSRLRRPVGRFNPELLGVLRVQSLPVAELHGLGADDAADWSSAEKA